MLSGLVAARWTWFAQWGHPSPTGHGRHREFGLEAVQLLLAVVRAGPTYMRGVVQAEQAAQDLQRLWDRMASRVAGVDPMLRGVVYH